MFLSSLRSRVKAIYTFERLRHNTKKYLHKKGCLIDQDTVFFVYLPATDYYYLPYFQLLGFNNVFVFFSYVNSNVAISRLLDKFLSNTKYKKFARIKYDKSKKYVFFFDGQYTICSTELREYLQNEYPGCKIIFHLGDLIKTKKGINIEDIKAFADLVVTYDHNDADENQLIYHPDPYSILPYGLLNAPNEKSQMIFYGYAKDRAKTLLSIYDKMKECGLRCDFGIPDLTEEDCINRAELANAQFTPYLDYLGKVQSSDCILEIIQGGSRGCTFRTWEAVVYNKRLVTNNQCVKEEAFYNSDYIQVIESFESLDLGWLKKDVNVDYNYADKLSPKACFEFYMDCINNMG